MTRPIHNDLYIPLSLTAGSLVLEIVDGISAVVLRQGLIELLVDFLLLSEVLDVDTVVLTGLLLDDGFLVVAQLVDDVLELTGLELVKEGNAFVRETDTVVGPLSVGAAKPEGPWTSSGGGGGGDTRSETTASS